MSDSLKYYVVTVWLESKLIATVEVWAESEGGAVAEVRARYRRAEYDFEAEWVG